MEMVNLGVYIKKLRAQLGYSQEDLAYRVFVSRQTISNWENAKSYPDITSLILLSRTFDVSIDQLVEGDFEIMQQTIQQSDIQDFKRYSTLMIASLVLGLILFLVSLYLGNIVGIILSVGISILGLALTYKASAIRRHYNVQTYREIVSFMNGETLDQISQARESGKRPYQNGIIIAICLSLDIIVIFAIFAIFMQNGII